MERVVLDASTAVGWVLNDDPAAVGMLDRATGQTQFVVPPIWYLEVANVLLKRERQRQITVEQVAQMLHAIGCLAIEHAPDPYDADLQRVVAAARPHPLSSYDATYLGLALQHGLPLCTPDQNLISAAAQTGVNRWPARGE